MTTESPESEPSAARKGELAPWRLRGSNSNEARQKEREVNFIRILLKENSER